MAVVDRHELAACAFVDLVHDLVHDVVAGASQVVVEIDGAGAVSAELRGVLLYAISEAVTNAARHAECDHVWVHLDWSRRLVRVIDDGRGFNPMMRAPGRGLLTLRQRVGVAGGEVTIRSVRGEGTIVALRF